MTAIATIVGYIREDLNRGSDYNDRIKRALMSAVHFYRARRFAFNQVRVASGMNPNEEFISAGPSYIQIDSIRVDDGGTGYYTLVKKNWGWIEDRQTSPTNTGHPVCYAVQARNIRFYPIPDHTCSLEITYLKDIWFGYMEPSDLSDSQSDAWTNEGEELIRLHAMVDLLQVYRQSSEDDAKADRLQSREARVLRELQVRASEEVASGEIQAFM